MPDKIPSRILWAVGLLDILPDQRILEIGCGLGAAAFVVSQHLTTGCITAIDSSLKMVSAARERNKENLDAGKCEILHLDWLSAPSLSRRFDSIFVKSRCSDGRFMSFAEIPASVKTSLLSPNGETRVLSFTNSLKRSSWFLIDPSGFSACSSVETLT